MPTQAVLPSATPAPASTLAPTVVPSDTAIPTPTATETPNLVETQLVQLQATNDVAQVTLDALQTRLAPTDSSELAMLSTLTTNTLAPSAATPLVVPMQPRLIYAQSAANLRPCPNQSCAPVTQLQAGEAVMATGTIQGEALTSGNPHWFRVDSNGRELYVYSQLVNVSPPTKQPVFVPPTTAEVTGVQPPVSVGCPSLSATCSQLSCDQAYACLAAGNRSLDRDGDGIPCESVCA